MQIITKAIPIKTLKAMAKKGFGNLVKAVVDVQKEVMVVDGELHADEEALLLKQGSKQEDLWGINLYPEIRGKDWVEFDSLINVRPSTQNLSRGVDNPKIRKQIEAIVNGLITK